MYWTGSLSSPHRSQARHHMTVPSLLSLDVSHPSSLQCFIYMSDVNRYNQNCPHPWLFPCSICKYDLMLLTFIPAKGWEKVVRVFGGMLSAPFALNYKMCLLYRVQTQSMQRKIKFLFFPSLPSNPRPLGKHGPCVSRKASASFPVYRQLFLHVPKHRQTCGCLGVHTETEKPNFHLNKP